MKRRLSRKTLFVIATIAVVIFAGILIKAGRDSGAVSGQKARDGIELVWPSLMALPETDRALLAGFAMTCDLADKPQSVTSVIACLRDAAANPDALKPKGMGQADAAARLEVLIDDATSSPGFLEKIGAAALKLGNIDTSHMAIQIMPGMKIKNGEGYATVSGFQKCMRADGIEQLKNDCIVVGKDTQTVQVQVHTRDGNTYENSVETWKVVRTPEHPDRMTLTRPSGEYVSPAEKDSGQ